jgi:5-methylcytosine-specific restriction enzyme subunit McrC
MVDVIAGEVPVDGFTLDMSQVFERFVRRALREATGLPERDSPDDWSGRGLTLAERGAVPLVPDLGIRVSGRWRFVGDVKYKRDDGPGRHGDVCQVLAYAVATGLPEATLIYAHGPAEPKAHVVRHLGVHLRLVHLDLTRSPEELLRSVFAVVPRRRAPCRRPVGGCASWRRGRERRRDLQATPHVTVSITLQAE